MRIDYKSKRLQKTCENASVAKKQYGLKMAIKIQQRIGELSAVSTVEEMVRFQIGRCHPLHGNRQDQYALDLVHPYRLVFTCIENEIQIARIEEIVDYH